MGEMDKIKNLIAELYWYNCQSYATCSLILGVMVKISKLKLNYMGEMVKTKLSTLEQVFMGEMYR